ncbi:MAG: SpoIID/LytB domain-containing protein [Rhodothermales bacterium]
MRAFATLFLLFAFGLDASAQGTTVRVRLLERQAPTTVTVSAEGGPLQVRVGDALLGTLTPGNAATIESARGAVTVRFLSVIETVPTVDFVPLRGTHLRLRAGSVDRTYHGSLAVSADGRGGRAPLRLVNTVELADYVASVVSSEYPFEEIEGVKAQAVLARTYALKARGKYGGYDLVDHVGSQVYRGIGSETPAARRAAEATRGEVLTYAGGLVEAVYSSSSGGHTADNESIWDGPPLPYLRGRDDPFDRAAPDHRWRTEVERGRLLRALSSHFGTAVTGLEVGDRSREGRVRTFRLLGSRPRTVQANAVRLAINNALGSRLMRSTFVSVERRGDRYVFEGRGFGHGVGMSQYGAREQARQGYSYRDILAFYFGGARLAPFAAVTTDAPAYADAVRPATRTRSVPVEPIPVLPTASERPASAPTIRTGW